MGQRITDAGEQQSVMVVRAACPGCGRLLIAYMASTYKHPTPAILEPPGPWQAEDVALSQNAGQ